MVATYHNWIGGRWVPAQSGDTRENIDPASGEVLGIFPRSGAEDIADAVSAAREAFDAWRAMPAPHRAEILFRAGEISIRRKEEFAQEMTPEMGKILREARGDVQESIDMTYYMAGEGRRCLGQTTPSELPSKFALSVRQPVGVVAAITPWNFPMALPAWKIMPSLVCGNTVVFKPAADVPKSGWNLAKALEEAGLPPGVLNVVFGNGGEAGTPLVEHPDIDLISFTGSNAVGRGIALKAAELGKRLHLELGGKNAIIILDDADVEPALDGVIWSAFGTSGQRCTSASRLIVQRGILDEFTERLIARTEALRLGHGLDEDTDVGPLANREQLTKVNGYMEVARQEGATIACGGSIANAGPLAKGFFFQPTVLTNVKPQMRVAQEEIFGPVTAVIAVDGLEEAIAVNNGVRFGLSTSIYTRDVNQAFRAIDGITTGVVYVNAGTIGAEVQLPFGGTRETGNGHREAGEAALDTYTEWKTVYVDYSGHIQKAHQIDR